jgi:hypothetical protein
MLHDAGVVVSNPINGSIVLTAPHYGYITSKVISDVYRGQVLPYLLSISAWKTRYPNGYDFDEDKDNLMSNRDFKDSMLGLYKKMGRPLPPTFNPMAVITSLQRYGNEIEGVSLSNFQRRGDNFTVTVTDTKAQQQNANRQAREAAKPKAGQRQPKRSRSDIFANYTQGRRQPAQVMPEVEDENDMTFLEE